MPLTESSVISRASLDLLSKLEAIQPMPEYAGLITALVDGILALERRLRASDQDADDWQCKLATLTSSVAALKTTLALRGAGKEEA